MNEQARWVVIRILITIGLMLILYFLLMYVNPRIVLFFYLLLIMLLDPIDSIPMKLKYGSDYDNSLRYQIPDKIGDIILEFVALNLYLSRINAYTAFDAILIGLFLYRLAGVILFTITGKDIVLVIFPNFFLENVMLYILLADILHLDKIVVYILVILSIPVKILYEYIHHMIWSRAEQG